MIGGQIQLMAMTAAQVAPSCQKRDPAGIGRNDAASKCALPDVPTFEEAGVPGYKLDIWYGLMAPAKTPVPILDKIHEEVKRFITLPATKKRLVASGVEELVTSRSEHAKVLKEDLDKYAKLIREPQLNSGQLAKRTESHRSASRRSSARSQGKRSPS